MIKKFLFFCVFMSMNSIAILAQQFNGRMGGMAGQQSMNMGHFYGKVVDAKTNKGIPVTTVQLIGNKFDTATKQLKKNIVLKTTITANNGDFSLENVPVIGNFTLMVSSVGYKSVSQNISFGIKFPQGGNAGKMDADAMQKLMQSMDKDLGNIKMVADATILAGVTVTATTHPELEIGIDRKVFNVDKNLTSTGQTATEIMKNIPSLNVDIDGNVTLRNATPTIFIDGRPTTMTLDEIPADIIDKVEIITNPSAKYDASGGNAGILNLVLKKNKKVGYNGGIRAGIDSKGKPSGGGDISLRQNKINITAMANYFSRKSKSTSTTNQSLDSLYAHIGDNSIRNGGFGFGRIGLDYFADNRNTFSVAANYNKGNFKSNETQTLDSSISTAQFSSTNRITSSNADFTNFGGQLSYKHNFTQNGHDITADANYNSSTTSSNSNINVDSYTPNGTTMYPSYLQPSSASGYNHYFTGQLDYENQISDNTKIEAGARAALRDFRTDNIQYRSYYPTSSTSLIINSIASSRYKYNDAVYAGYVTYSSKIKKWSYLLGLRAESSNYKGQLYTVQTNQDSSKLDPIKYPLSLFPSVFLTYKIDDRQDFQINYSRRVNRPNFFQLLPSYNFTIPQSPSVGNPNLKPEFTNSFEMSYNNTYAKGADFLATVYFKYTTDLITSYIYKDIDRNTNEANSTDSLFYTSYTNADKSYSYGLELTNKTSITKWWDFNINVNLYNSSIKVNVSNQTINNSLLSGFTKMNNTFKVSKGWSLQFSGNYQTKSLVPQSSGSGGGGRGGFYGGSQTLAQGYVLPRISFDAALRKDWTWKKGQTGSLTLSMSDIFKTNMHKTTSTSTFDSEVYTQRIERRRDPQLLRLTFTYRFGKFDNNLFKRKNNKVDQNESQDTDMMSQQ